jgi:hypothetical protein
MDPLDAAGGIGIAGLAITAIAGIARAAIKSRQAHGSNPPLSARSKSGEMRAIKDALLEEERDKQLRAEVHAMHEIVKQRDPDGIPRVHNKPSVEQAILESRELDRRQVELLEAILLELRSSPKPPGTYRMKMPSARGGE